MPWRTPSGTCSTRSRTGLQHSQQYSKHWTTQLYRKLHRAMLFKMHWIKQRISQTSNKIKSRMPSACEERYFFSCDSHFVTRDTCHYTSGSPLVLYILTRSNLKVLEKIFMFFVPHWWIYLPSFQMDLYYRFLVTFIKFLGTVRIYI